MAGAYTLNGGVIEGEAGNIRESQFFKNLHWLSLKSDFSQRHGGHKRILTCVVIELDLQVRNVLSMHCGDCTGTQSCS